MFDELQLSTGFVSRQFDYHIGAVTDTHAENEKLKSTPTTQLVKEILFSDGRTIGYEYDEEERITKVTDSVDGVTEYTYDALGQLLTETVNGTVINTMTYDNYGNILSKNGVTYTYGDDNWQDLLTQVGGKTITYDAQGNPTNYVGHTLTWEKGRQLKRFVKENGTVIDYIYNANGIRTSKAVRYGGNENAPFCHNYVLEGTKILREEWVEHGETYTLVPMYNNEDEVCGIAFDGTPYYFVKNLQGDVIALTGWKGQIVARYTYDAWGVPTVTFDATQFGIATINPFLYRGYYYDWETDFYYLQSRCYDSTSGSFLNSDEGNIVVLSDGITNNLYVYCNNDPLNSTEISGFWTVKSVLKSWIPKLVNSAKKFGEFLLNFWGMSANQFAHKKKYNNATKMMRFVNENLLHVVYWS